MLEFLAQTSRVSRALTQEGEYRVYPSSCTVFAYDKNKQKLSELLQYVSEALARGAGVKVQLGKFKPDPKIKDIQWKWFVDENHEEISNTRLLAKPYTSTRVMSLENLPDNYRVIKVLDSMRKYDMDIVEEGFTIEHSWDIFEYYLRLGVTPVVDLSELRPIGRVNKAGLHTCGIFGDLTGTSLDKDSGGFLAVYFRIFNHIKFGSLSTLLQLLGQVNRTIHRGGFGKQGIVCTGMDYDSPTIREYLNIPINQLLGSQKKGIRINSELLKYPPLVALISEKVNTESLFLEKIHGKDIDGEDLYSNVCQEVILRHKASCLISHINAGMITEPEQWLDAYPQVTRYLAEIHVSWRDKVKQKVLFLPLSEDRQICVGIVGLANMLANMGITYKQHTQALEYISSCIKMGWESEIPEVGSDEYMKSDKAHKVAYCIYWGLQAASKVADEFGIERAFGLAPTQTVAYNHKDIEGNTLSRSIDPPFHKRIRRNSDRVGAKWYFHGKNIETAENVGAEIHETQTECFQVLFDSTGKSHSISYDLYHNCSPEWLEYFILHSPLKTTYYNFTSQLSQNHLNKGFIPKVIKSDCESCAE